MDSGYSAEDWFVSCGYIITRVYITSFKIRGLSDNVKDKQLLQWQQYYDGVH